jgi:hypothetical protein
MLLKIQIKELKEIRKQIMHNLRQSYSRKHKDDDLNIFGVFKKEKGFNMTELKKGR